jgi:hypothetical protein
MVSAGYGTLRDDCLIRHTAEPDRLPWEVRRGWIRQPDRADTSPPQEPTGVCDGDASDIAQRAERCDGGCDPLGHRRRAVVADGADGHDGGGCREGQQ